MAASGGAPHLGPRPELELELQPLSSGWPTAGSLQPLPAAATTWTALMSPNSPPFALLIIPFFPIYHPAEARLVDCHLPRVCSLAFIANFATMPLTAPYSNAMRLGRCSSTTPPEH